VVPIDRVRYFPRSHLDSEATVIIDVVDKLFVVIIVEHSFFITVTTTLLFVVTVNSQKRLPRKTC
jgi:predicted glycosyltransferase involved in capsule biosynthesis